MRFLEGALWGAGLLIVALAVLPGDAARRLAARNYRGRPVPAVLGLALAVPSIAAAAVVRTGWEIVGRPFEPVPWLLVVGGAVVVAAGLADDLVTGGPRGLRGHARALFAGRPSTGFLKLLAIVGAAALATWGSGLDAHVTLLQVVTVAGAANLWNGLDVAPGRALKAFVPVMGVLMLFLPTVPYALSFGAALVALRVDLRERAMLGDAGSNLLGFLVGLGLASELHPWELWIAATALVVGNLVAETLTLSRVIDGSPLLRWLDRLGRRRPRPSRARISRR